MQIQVVTIELTKSVLKQMDFKNSLTKIEATMCKVHGRIAGSLVERGEQDDYLLISIGSQNYILRSHQIMDALCRDKLNREFEQSPKIIITK